MYISRISDEQLWTSWPCNTYTMVSVQMTSPTGARGAKLRLTSPFLAHALFRYNSLRGTYPCPTTAGLLGRPCYDPVD